MPEYDIVIIDPATTEHNKGSFVYLVYLFYLGLKSFGSKVKLIENFTIAEMDNLPKAKEYFVACSTYPQIDACFVLNRFMDNVKFFGYTPMIKHYNLPCYVVPQDYIRTGMYNYPEYYKELKYLLLSDCDMHLKKYTGDVVPLFTSYGCPRGCAFCPSTVNCNKERLSLDISKVKGMLTRCNLQGYTNIHFTDEDFFYDIDRTYLILKHIEKLSSNFQLIALGDVTNVLRFINKYGNSILLDSGMKLIEVGLETADEVLGKAMGKAPVDRCRELADKSEVDIFWLALTFFPGETLITLSKTGEFLRKHGYNLGELYGRIATNSTEGGLGQFFQPYHGTKNYDRLNKEGIFISDRPIRLIPSYLPDSFLLQPVVQKAERSDIKEWFDLYKLKPPGIIEGLSIFSIFGMTKMKGMSVADTAISYAIYARLGII